jgi:cytochrome c oxidase subunit IV
MASTSAPSAGHAEAHDDGGIGRLILIWVLLLVLTATTFGVSRLPIGHLHLPAAIFIACIKVTLVVLFFMHLWHAEGSNRIVFVVSFFFVLVLLFFVLADIATRFPLSNSRIPPMPQVDQKLVPSGMPPGMPAPTGSHTGEEGHR